MDSIICDIGKEERREKREERRGKRKEIMESRGRERERSE